METSLRENLKNDQNRKSLWKAIFWTCENKSTRKFVLLRLD